MMDLKSKTIAELLELSVQDHTDDPKAGFDACSAIREELYSRGENYQASLVNAEVRYWQGYWHRDRRES